MSNSPSLNSPGPTAVDPSLSRPVLLRQSREAAGLHIAALAASLKVPVKKLEALEAGRYGDLPDLTFARALASSACRQLKIDPGPVLEQIPTAHSPQLGDSAQSINTPFKHAQAPAPFHPMGWLSRPAVLAAIAVLLAALVLVFIPDMKTPSLVDAVMPPPGAAAIETTAAAEPPPLDPAANLSASVPPSGSEPVAGPDPASLAANTSVAPVPAPAPGSVLSIAATGDSWVEVVNGNGGTVVQRMLKSGDVLDFSTAPPYAVVLGRADATRVTVRGKPFDVTPYARNSVARFEVK